MPILVRPEGIQNTIFESDLCLSFLGCPRSSLFANKVSNTAYFSLKHRFDNWHYVYQTRVNTYFPRGERRGGCDECRRCPAQENRSCCHCSHERDRWRRGPIDARQRHQRIGG